MGRKNKSISEGTRKGVKYDQFRCQPYLKKKGVLLPSRPNF